MTVRKRSVLGCPFVLRYVSTAVKAVGGKGGGGGGKGTQAARCEEEVST